jgi:hypothetical protein
VCAGCVEFVAVEACKLEAEEGLDERYGRKTRAPDRSLRKLIDPFAREKWEVSRIDGNCLGSRANEKAVPGGLRS